MIKVKICGITNLEDAQASIDAGCDALGFVFYKKSPRYIRPQIVAEIIKHLPAKLIKIGVFVNAKEEAIKRIAKLDHLDMLQFHGNESPGFCRKFKKYKVIKAFRIKDKIDLPMIARYKTFAYLFDTFVKSKIGGTGRKFDWKLLRHLDGLKQPVFLSGGLTAKNVKRATRSFKPAWLDASTSLEKYPGKKDSNKIRNFIRAAKGINR
ncbi:MAG: phosphoribosylanthranilate isomerase [Candidatus Omnitrophica bacterium]|nr:phosphoribosylanthranilate isomerase [Candidatus Omnitrophota bacterium]